MTKREEGRNLFFLQKGGRGGESKRNVGRGKKPFGSGSLLSRRVNEGEEEKRKPLFPDRPRDRWKKRDLKKGGKEGGLAISHFSTREGGTGLVQIWG